MLCHFRPAVVLALLLSADLAGAQTVVNSTFVGGEGSYGEPTAWDPPVIPNNTATTHYNVTMGEGFLVAVEVDATISNLTLRGATDVFVIDHAFAVAGATTNEGAATAFGIHAFGSAPASFDAGILSTFSNRTLRGTYDVRTAGSPATLQFKGADIVTLTDGWLILEGVSARIIDEAGNDGLRNFERIDTTGALELRGRNVIVPQPFTNAGRLTLSSSLFLAAGSLTNYDPATRTLAAGVFSLAGTGELRFSGADIESLGSEVTLFGSAARIADTAGNDGLRNLARLLPEGRLTLISRNFTTAGDFTNDGALSVSGEGTFVVSGSLTNFDATTRTLSGGAFAVGNAQLQFRGADIVRNAAKLTLSSRGSINDLAGADALRNFAENLSGGVFTLGAGYNFTAAGQFTNAGAINIDPQIFTTRQYVAAPRFTVPPGLEYTQTAGSTRNDGVLTAQHVNIRGGSLAGRGTIDGNATIGDATLISSPHMLINGDLTLEPGSRFRYAVQPFNSPREVIGEVALGGTLEIDVPSDVFPARGAVFQILASAKAITGSFTNAPDSARVATRDGSGSFRVGYDNRHITISDFQLATPAAQLLNISTRAFLTRSDADPAETRSVVVGGFIITGREPKTVVVRGLGPSLGGFGVASTLADPTLELYGSGGMIIATNDNWKATQQSQITAAGLAPGDDREAAIMAALPAGVYTVALREKSGSEGHGLVEVYDVSRGTGNRLANISTRGFVDSEHVLIGGVIAGGDGPGNAEIVVRAIGPELASSGLTDALGDPTLEVRTANGTLVASNDSWSTNSEQPGLSSLFPGHLEECAVHLSLPPANYTAIVRGKDGASGVALVEVYDLRR